MKAEIQALDTAATDILADDAWVTVTTITVEDNRIMAVEDHGHETAPADWPAISEILGSVLTDDGSRVTLLDDPEAFLRSYARKTYSYQRTTLHE